VLLGYGLSTWALNEPSVAQKVSFLGTGGRIAAVIVAALLFGIIFFYLYGTIYTLVRRISGEIEKSVFSIPAPELLFGAFGLVTGLFVAYLISSIINGIGFLRATYLNTVISVLLYLLLGYFGSVLGRRLSRDIRRGLPSIALNANIRAAAGKTRVENRPAKPKILDTSVIIDGRISDILKAGFLEGTIVIPDFVLGELQRLADSSDSMKRSKGRRGLDILAKLQTDYGLDIRDTSGDRSLDDIPEVDVKLIKLAMSIKGMVMTNDFNLNKVAAIQGVPVLNINELANTLKPVVLPGETLRVFLVKEGKENSQALAYLDDGTMIVVENGKKMIGQTVSTTVTSVLQTSAGRMIFAKPN
jgi:uncharacterized protein YacL